MDVQMIAQEFPLTPSLRARLERRLRFAFARAFGRVQRIVVRLRGTDGSHGARDQICQVSVSVPGRPDVVVREANRDMHCAIDGAITRAAFRVTPPLLRRRKSLAASLEIPYARRDSRKQSEGYSHG